MNATAEVVKEEQDEWITAKRGCESTAGARVLDEIFDIAVSHDSLCRFYASKLEAVVEDEDLPTVYRQAITNLCSIIAPAAMKRIPASDVFSKAVVDTGTLWELAAGERDAFLRPIFEESGIGPRYEP